MLFRPTASASRAVLRSFNAASQRSHIVARPSTRSQLCTLTRRPQAAAASKPLALQLLRARYADTRGPVDTTDKKREEKNQAKILEADPETVSASSSIHPVFGEARVEQSGENETDMLAGVKSDMVGHEPCSHSREDAAS